MLKQSAKMFSLLVALVLLCGMLTACSEKPMVYTNQDLGFSLELPPSWEGLYGIQEHSTGIDIYHKASNEEMRQGLEDLTEEDVLGVLIVFCVSDEQPDHGGNSHVLGEKDGKYYYYFKPSDVQYSTDPNSQSAKQYQEMADQLDDVIASFKII